MDSQLEYEFFIASYMKRRKHLLKAPALNCDCENQKIILDEFHDEEYCLNCGTVLRQALTVYIFSDGE